MVDSQIPARSAYLGEAKFVPVLNPDIHYGTIHGRVKTINVRFGSEADIAFRGVGRGSRLARRAWL
jgi:hypothetical protein